MARLDPRTLLHRPIRGRSVLARAAELTRAILDRLVEIQWVDRSIALGSLAFTALVPLLVITAAYMPGADGIADELIDRFHLHGSTADLVRQVFAQPDDVKQSLSWLGVALLVGSSLSFTRALQRVYESAWRLPARGWRGTKAGLKWIGGIVLWLTVFAAVRNWLLDQTGPLGTLIILLTGDALLWLWSPWVLLSQRVHWHRLVPTALLASVAMTAFSIGSVVYMPDAIATSAEHYGSIGIAIALVSWLVGAGFALAATAAVGAVIGDWGNRDATRPADAVSPD
jgi:membrane protein